MVQPPKKTTLPIIDSEQKREEIVRDLSPTHGYSIAEAAYILNLCKRTIMRYINDGTFEARYRGVHPLVSGLQIKNFYFN